jgi:hypothetical protein
MLRRVPASLKGRHRQRGGRGIARDSGGCGLAARRTQLVLLRPFLLGLAGRGRHRLFAHPSNGTTIFLKLNKFSSYDRCLSLPSSCRGKEGQVRQTASGGERDMSGINAGRKSLRWSTGSPRPREWVSHGVTSFATRVQ